MPRLPAINANSKNCPRCQKAFQCLADSDTPCCCTQLHLPPTLLETLRKNYADCLCPQCLHELAANSGADAPVGSVDSSKFLAPP